MATAQLTVDFEPGRVIHIGKKDGEGRLLQAQIADEVWEYSVSQNIR